MPSYLERIPKALPADPANPLFSAGNPWNPKEKVKGS